ncbi:unnamed protein product, partial [Sphacelaria rigidula]
MVGDYPHCCRHATEAEERQRVINKQRALDAKQVKQLRGEAKRRREQELAIWQEQRDEAKQRKAPGASRSSSGAVREGKVAMGLTDEATGRDENDAKPAAELQGKAVELRIPFPPPGRVVTGAELSDATVESVGLAPRGRVMVQF